MGRRPKLEGLALTGRAVGPDLEADAKSIPFMIPSTRGYQTIERAAALAIATLSVRIFFMRASGRNGLPFSVPMEASG